MRIFFKNIKDKENAENMFSALKKYHSEYIEDLYFITESGTYFEFFSLWKLEEHFTNDEFILCSEEKDIKLDYNNFENSNPKFLNKYLKNRKFSKLKEGDLIRIINFCEFDIYKTPYNYFRLFDLQKGNLGNIEEERFKNIIDIIDRISESYIEDYF